MLYADKAALENRTKVRARRICVPRTGRAGRWRLAAVQRRPTGGCCAPQVRLLGIRERELELYVKNCRTLGNIAAIIAGMTFTGFVCTPARRAANSA